VKFKLDGLEDALGENKSAVHQMMVTYSFTWRNAHRHLQTCT